jgi:hypothetical protein
MSTGFPLYLSKKKEKKILSSKYKIESIKIDIN